MTLVVVLMFILIVINNIWIDRRISALERRWNAFIDKQGAGQPSYQASLSQR